MFYFYIGIFEYSCSRNIQGCNLVDSMFYDNYVCSCSVQWLYYKCYNECIDIVYCSCYRSNQIYMGVDKCDYGNYVNKYMNRCY